MTSINFITWSEIEDSMKSMICEFLDFVDNERLTNFKVLEWLENAWKLLVKSGVVNYSTQLEYFHASLYCVALFCLYAEYSELGIVDCEDFLDVADFWGINICNLEKTIDEDIETEDIDEYFERETIELINNIFREVVAILIKKFGSRLKLFESIQKSIQIEENLFEDDTFDRAEAEDVKEQIKIDDLAERWEEIEGDEVRKATLKLACYFEGEIIDIEEVKPMINHGDPNFQTNRFKNMKYETISPKYLFSRDTFKWLTAWGKDNHSSSLFATYIYYAEIVEYVEEPFNRLCYLVSAKLPLQLSAQPGDATWNERELEKKFSHFKLLYIRLNPNYLTFGYSQEIYRLIFLNVLHTNPDRLKKIIKNQGKEYDILNILDMSNNECFITKNELINLSTSQLSDQIAQFFLNHLDLILLATVDDKKTELVNKSKLNPKYSLNQFSQETGFTEPQLTQWKNAINRKGQTIIQGPPGTGKTFIAERLAKHLIGGGDGFSDIIQFHPAYTYEDFIEGLRPITKNGQLTYSIVSGRFLQFCEKAEACEDTCVIIIDEINRANLSQVFGELMYLLDDRQNTERSIILASGQSFRIPTNVRIIGTMNTADRSIALVDNALRRRFAFIPISPNYELLQNYHNREETDFPVDKLIGILKEVNQAINNKHYELGISFFLTKTLAEDIQDIWEMEIEPYLEEYFFDNQTKMDKFLWNKIKDELSKG